MQFMQFLIRTLLVIALFFAIIFCAAATFRGLSVYYAIGIFVWLLLAGVYLIIRDFRSALIPHFLGPIIALGFCILHILAEKDTWKDLLELLPPQILIGLFVGIVVGFLYTIVLRDRKQHSISPEKER
jgi:hypothetical protein